MAICLNTMCFMRVQCFSHNTRPQPALEKPILSKPKSTPFYSEGIRAGPGGPGKTLGWTASPDTEMSGRSGPTQLTITSPLPVRLRFSLFSSNM